MDFSLTSDQVLIRDTVRQFMETEMRPKIREYEREHKYPIAELRKLGELGCCGMMIPEEWGGAGTDTISYAVMIEEVARVDASTAVVVSVTNTVSAGPVIKHGSEAQLRIAGRDRFPRRKFDRFAVMVVCRQGSLRLCCVSGL